MVLGSVVVNKNKPYKVFACGCPGSICDDCGCESSDKTITVFDRVNSPNKCLYWLSGDAW